VVLLDTILITLIVLELEISSKTSKASTETDGSLKFFLALCDGIVVKCKLFSILDVSDRIHSYLISAIYNLDYGLAVGIARVTQS